MRKKAYKWTPELIDQVRVLVKDYSVKEVGLMLDIPNELIKGMMNRNKIHTGRTGCFQKGKRWVDYMSQDKIENCRKTQFKKGIIPFNTKPEGYEAIRVKKGRSYRMIKIAGQKMRHKHIYEWEKVNGKVPKGMNVIFINRDTLDCSIGNLKLVSDAELMRMNSYLNFPEDLRKVMQLKSVLKRKINQYDRNTKS